jgi:hypothetical protein
VVLAVLLALASPPGTSTFWPIVMPPLPPVAEAEAVALPVPELAVATADAGWPGPAGTLPKGSPIPGAPSAPISVSETFASAARTPAALAVIRAKESPVVCNSRTKNEDCGRREFKVENISVSPKPSRNAEF